MNPLVLSGEVIFAGMLIVLAFIIGRDFPSQGKVAKIKNATRRKLAREYTLGSWICVAVRVDQTGGHFGHAIQEVVLENDRSGCRVIFVNNSNLKKGDRVSLHFRDPHDQFPTCWISELELILKPVHL